MIKTCLLSVGIFALIVGIGGFLVLMGSFFAEVILPELRDVYRNHRRMKWDQYGGVIK